MIGGTNVAIIKNATTGKNEIVAHDTVYSSGNGIDINNANQVSVKVDGSTVDFNSSGELTVIGGGSGGAVIDDTQASSSTVYSSNKTDAQIMSAYTALANNVQNYYLTQANAASTYVASTDIRNIVKITETAYNNLQNPDANTFYVVVPDPSV